jgi:hypothetical protein
MRIGDFFKSLFGFSETNYSNTKKKLEAMATFETVANGHYHREKCTFQLKMEKDGFGVSLCTVSAGTFSFPSVQELRAHTAELAPTPPSNGANQNEAVRGRIRIKNVVAEARSLHLAPDNDGAVVQAASQFNGLEFISPHRTPEYGITRYVNDPTQGPACAIACAAGTAYRNYLVPVPFGLAEVGLVEGRTRGQTRTNQLNGLIEIEAYLIQETSLEYVPWKVKNGYIDSTVEQLTSFNTLLTNEDISEEALLARLRIAVQEHTTVTDDPALRQTVTQTYNSAVSVAYSSLPPNLWEPLARLVLRATYESTLLVGLLAAIEASASRGPTQPPPTVFLTQVGGGAFGNKREWIVDAIQQAVERVSVYGVDLNVKVVHRGHVHFMYNVLETVVAPPPPPATPQASSKALVRSTASSPTAEAGQEHPPVELERQRRSRRMAHANSTTPVPSTPSSSTVEAGQERLPEDVERQRRTRRVRVQPQWYRP